MNYLKRLGKSFIYIVSILFVSTIMITLLNYVDIFGSKLTNIFKIVSIIASLFVGGFIMGKSAKSKGWLEGLKLSLIIIGILLILNYLILKSSFEIRNLIFYLILMISGIFGSMIGINKNQIEEK